MISSVPKSKIELIKAIQAQNIQQIEIVEPYHPTKLPELSSVARQMVSKQGDVAIILVRTA